METRIVKIIADDGCFYEDEYASNLTNKEIVDKVLESACKPIKEIYNEHFELMWRKRYTVKLANGKYAFFDMNSYKYLDAAIQKLGEMEDEEESELGL